MSAETPISSRAVVELLPGINKTFDNVVIALNEGMRVSEEYAAGNFTARFDESVKMRGEFKKFKTSLNDIGEQVSKAMRGISTQVTDLAASAEEANASVEEVAAGAGAGCQERGSSQRQC